MLAPVTLPCYLAINQSENCAQVGHLPCDPLLPHLAFKNALLKLFGESCTHPLSKSHPFSLAQQ